MRLNVFRALRRVGMPRLAPLFALIAVLGANWSAHAQSWRVSPEAALETRLFVEEPAFPEQLDTVQAALILTGDARWTSSDRNRRVLIEPYVRLDSADTERTYVDLREASMSWRAGDWDVLAGVSQVFWGVAESRNVVDIINQFDAIEDFDEGEKLGQPMLRVSRRTDVGSFEAFYLPFFRERRFPGADGRLRGEPLVDADAAQFERDNEEWAGDWALRYRNSVGAFDVGVHAFYGTSRAPFLQPNDDFSRLIPFYQELSQAGVDVQYTEGPWLLKFEAAGVDVGGETFLSTVGGFEYTFFDLRRSGIDIGVIGELLYDERDPGLAPASIVENDVFAGARLTFNDSQDTEVLGGAIIDVETGATLATVEFQRRIGMRLLAELEGRYFEASGDALIQAFDADSHISVRLTRYF